MTRVVFDSNVIVSAVLVSESVLGRVIVDLITYKDQMKGIFQPVIPAKAGIQGLPIEVDSRFRGNDGLLQDPCPGFHQPKISGRALRVIGKGVELS